MIKKIFFISIIVCGCHQSSTDTKLFLSAQDSADHFKEVEINKREIIKHSDTTIIDKFICDYRESALLNDKDIPVFYGKFSVRNDKKTKIYLFIIGNADDVAFFYETHSGNVIYKGYLSPWMVDYYLWGKEIIPQPTNSVEHANPFK